MKVFNSFWLPFFTLVFNMLMMPNALAQAKGKILYEFTDGGSNQPLTLDAKGNIYGTTLLTVFELTPNSDGSWSEQTIYTVVDGEGPSFVVLDGAGNLYGTVGNGGNHSCNPPDGCGYIFELSPSSSGSWTETTLYTFNGTGTDGTIPQYGLAIDAAGNLYGTTGAGGSGGYGTVFELSPIAGGIWVETILYNFPARKVQYPTAPLALDNKGNIFGITGEDGDFSQIFELSPGAGGGWVGRKIFDANSRRGRRIGGIPSSGLIADGNGNLFGSTLCDGTVYELSPAGDGWALSVLHHFVDTTGRNCYYGPKGRLAIDSSGNIYGIDYDLAFETYHPGVFELSPVVGGSGWNFMKIYRLPGVFGDPDIGGVVLDNSGNIYGATYEFGRIGSGTVFEVVP